MMHYIFMYVLNISGWQTLKKNYMKLKFMISFTQCRWRIRTGHVLLNVMTEVVQSYVLSWKEGCCKGSNLEVSGKRNGGTFLDIIMTVSWGMSKICEVFKSGVGVKLDQNRTRYLHNMKPLVFLSSDFLRPTSASQQRFWNHFSSKYSGCMILRNVSTFYQTTQS